MPLDINDFNVHSEFPSLKNFQSGEFDIRFNGTLAAPSGGSVSNLSKSNSIQLDQDADTLQLFVIPNEGYTADVGSELYEANELLALECFPFVYANNEGGSSPNNSWQVDIYANLNGNVLTITLDAYNAGGTSGTIVFDATFTFRYISFLQV